MIINIVNPTAEKINAKRLQRGFTAILGDLLTKKLRQKKKLLEKKEIVFIFLSESEMKKINFQYRGKNKSTDVLSFQSDDPAALGELAFCLPVLKKQARRQKQALDQELLYMMIHGVLHLLGYDHELSKLEEKRMFQIQDSCFEQVRHLAKVL